MQSPHSNLPTQKTEFENLRSTKSSVANLKESKRSQLANVLTKFTRSFCKLYLTYPYVTYMIQTAEPDEFVFGMSTIA
jgi:galactose-1-phosphate uridylyltransferase